MQQLIWLETLLKASGGAVLLLAPLTACRVLGLPRPPTGLWPRLLGAVLVGVAAASYAEGAGWSGLGLAGSVLINFVAAGAIFALLVLGSPAPTRRGRIALSALAGSLAFIALVELAFI